MARTETVTVAFTDLVGSTELASRIGHDAYELLRRSHFDALRLAVANHNGSEIKTTGDGLMLRFSSTADAVECAIAIQQSADTRSRQKNAPPLEIRIGVSSGEATSDGGDLYGPPVVEASRLCAAASAGQILVSDVVRSLTRGKGHRFTPIGELTLKGLPEPVSVHEVVWEPLPKPASVIIGVLAQTGEYWTVGYGDASFSLKDVKGLSYIQRLLQHPGKEFHALDLLDRPGAGLAAESARPDEASLLRDPSVGSGGLGDAGEMLDARAKQEYKGRLLELREKLTDLRGRGDSDRAAEVEAEIDFLAREIARAVGLGGRDRRAGSAAERARLNVTRAIKGALQKISEHNVELGKLLDRTIRTGSFCSYVADPRFSISWQLAPEGAKPSVDAESTAPLLFKASASFLRSLVDRTTFVGRTEEYAALWRFLDQAVAGESRVVMVGGPPGVGKTRMATEFGAEASAKGYLILGGNCYDRADAVPFIPLVEILDDALARAPTPEAFRQALGDDAAEVARVMPQLRRMFPDIPPATETTPEQSRRVLFNAIAKFLARSAANRPVLIILEDLHWADEGTLALLTHLARSVRNLPVMFIGTFRDYELGSNGPLAQMLDECTRLHLLERVNLHGLSPASVADMIRTLSGQEPPPSLVDAIYSRTEGNPFFVEESYKHLKEQGRLFDSSGKFRRSFKADDLDVPPSVRLIIGRRLAGLDDGTRKTLGTAAVIGRSFTFALFEASTEADADLLLDSLEEAEAAGLVSSSLEHREALFQFSHELVQRVVLTDLSAPRRQRLHLRVADAIERIHASNPDDYANELAHHLWMAGSAAQPARTIKYLTIAAKRARSQSAYESAHWHFKNALGLIEQLPQTGARDQQQLELYLEYFTVVSLTNRWTTSEAGRAYKHARELCERLEQTPRMYRLLHGSAAYHLGRGELRLTREYGQRILELAEKAARPDWAVPARYLIGHALCCLGDLKAAHEQLAEAVRLLDATTQAGRIAKSAKISSLCVDAMALWALGFPDQSMSKLNVALTTAKESNEPFDIALALIHEHMVVMFSRQYSRALEIADEGVKLITEKNFEWFLTSLVWSRDACRILAGVSTNIDGLRDTFNAYFASEAKMYKPTNCTVLAECCGEVGQPEQGLSMIDAAITAMDENDDRRGEPETWRVKGVLLLQLAGSQSISHENRKSFEVEAETCFRKAIDVARRQTSRMWELRATTSLSRLLAGSGRKHEAQPVLLEIYSWFTEGFDTPDLQEAKALLGELS